MRVHERLYNSSVKKVTLALSISLGGVLVSGCANPAPKEGCAAVSASSGEKVTPDSYPLGNVFYGWTDDHHEAFYAPNTVSTGEIVKTDGDHFVLEAPDLPQASGLATNPNYLNHAVVVGIDTPQTGKIGFTTGCVKSGHINGLDITYLTLPSKS